MTLVLDANVVVAECMAADPFGTYEGDDLAAPLLMWSEACSSIHEAVWRREIPETMGRKVLTALEKAPVGSRAPRRLRSEAWRIAEDLGLAKTYDAEYLALAIILGCRMVTLDARLRRGADRLGLVVSPLEL